MSRALGVGFALFELLLAAFFVGAAWGKENWLFSFVCGAGFAACVYWASCMLRDAWMRQ